MGQAKGGCKSIHPWCISGGGRRQLARWEQSSLVSAAGGKLIHGCPLVSLGWLPQPLGDPSRSGHGAASTQPGHASPSSSLKPLPEAGV